MRDWSQVTPDSSITRGRAPGAVLELLFLGVTRSSFPLGRGSTGGGKPMPGPVIQNF